MSEDKEKLNLDDTLDWEYSSNFYNNNGPEKKLKLEDFMVDDQEPNSDNLDSITEDSDTLKNIIKDVKAVREYMETGKTVVEIAQAMNKDEDYINLIAISLCSSTEDSGDIAVAHLVMMG